MNAQLVATANHFRKMAADERNPAGERTLWAHLADEIDAYLAGERALDEQETLL